MLLAFQRLLQQSGELFRLSTHACFQLVELALQSGELIGQMQAGEHGDTRRIGVRRLARDVVHQVVDTPRQIFYFFGISLRKESIGLSEDRDTHRLFLRGIHSGLRPAELIDLAEKLLDAVAHLLALRPQRLHLILQLA